MIAPEQIADLRPGDVVELTDSRWGGVRITGPIRITSHGLCVGPWLLARNDGTDHFAEAQGVERHLLVTQPAVTDPADTPWVLGAPDWTGTQLGSGRVSGLPCGAVDPSPMGWLCTRNHDHPLDWHVAGDGEQILAVWAAVPA